MSVDDRLHQTNKSLRLFHEGEGRMLPVEEVFGGKGLVDKYPSFSLYLTILVIKHWNLGFPQGHLQGSASLKRGVLMETGWMPPIEWETWSENWWTQSGHRVHRTGGSPQGLPGQILQV
jgi:hypothetical protein